MKEKIINYIETLEAKSLQVDDYFKQRNELYIENQNKDKEIEKLNNRIEKCKEDYITTCEEQNKYISSLQENLNIAEEKCLKLNNIINEFEEELKWQRKVSLSLNVAFAVSRIDTLINKLQELKGSNDSSYEEMVGFVENVCKDIKSQPTLHEELEEERKTIAKIIGDFKEVNK